MAAADSIVDKNLAVAERQDRAKRHGDARRQADAIDEFQHAAAEHLARADGSAEVDDGSSTSPDDDADGGSAGVHKVDAAGFDGGADGRCAGLHGFETTTAHGGADRDTTVDELTAGGADRGSASRARNDHLLAAGLD